MSEARARIATHIRAHPGVHFNGLVRSLEYAPGQVQHHLKSILAEEAFREERLFGRTHYYPAGFDDWERRTLALLRRETARDVLAVLLGDGPARPGPLAEEVGVARSTLEWHLERLESAGVLSKERDDAGGVRLVLESPADLERLLRDVDPTLLGRMVDRYTRLVDRLLTE